MKKMKLILLSMVLSFVAILSGGASLPGVDAKIDTEQPKITLKSSYEGSGTEQMLRGDGTLEAIVYYTNNRPTKVELFSTTTMPKQKSTEELTYIIHFRADGTLKEIAYYAQGILDHVIAYREGTIFDKRTMEDVHAIFKFRTDGSLEKIAYISGGTMYSLDLFRKGTVYNTRTMKDVIKTYTFRADGTLDLEKSYMNGHVRQINCFRATTNYEMQTMEDLRFVFILVPGPQDDYVTMEYQYIEGSLKAILYFKDKTPFNTRSANDILRTEYSDYY